MKSFKFGIGFSVIAMFVNGCGQMGKSQLRGDENQNVKASEADAKNEGKLWEGIYTPTSMEFFNSLGRETAGIKPDKVEIKYINEVSQVLTDRGVYVMQPYEAFSIIFLDKSGESLKVFYWRHEGKSTSDYGITVKTMSYNTSKIEYYHDSSPFNFQTTGYRQSSHVDASLVKSKDESNVEFKYKSIGMSGYGNPGTSFSSFVLKMKMEK